MRCASFTGLTLAALSLAGCGGEELSCSSQTVLDTVGSISRKTMANTPDLVIFDMQKASFRVEDIRKQEVTPSRITCAANIYARLVPGEGMVNNPATGVPWTKETLDAIANQAIDITYTVEKTETGGIYVTVKGL